MLDDAHNLRLYCGRDNVIQRSLHDSYVDRLAELPNGTHLMAELTELQLIADRMCWNGIRVDPERLRFHHAQLQERIQKADAQLYLMAESVGFPLTKLAGKQVNDLYFNHLGVQPIKWTDGGGRCLDAQVLTTYLNHDNPVVCAFSQLLLERRKWSTLDSTFVAGLPVVDGLVHPFWRPGGAISLRWSSSKPNLMNIPNPQYDFKNGERIMTHPGLRDIYLPLREGDYIVEADYKQIELRLAAYQSEDPALLKVFEDGLDPHDSNARNLFGVKNRDVTERERTLTKGGTYLAIYEGRADRLWETVVPQFPGFRVRDAQAFLDVFFATYTGIPAWHKRLEDEARLNGSHTCELSGRARYWWDMLNVNELFNMDIQPKAAYLINQAIRRVSARLDWEKESILLQLHDALYLCGPDPYKLACILEEEMEGVDVTLRGRKTHFPIDLKCGRGWGSLHKTTSAELRQK